MYVCNFYIGNQEYVVQFKNGIHRVVEILPDYLDMENPTVFVGHYNKCMEYLDIRNIANLESQF